MKEKFLEWVTTQEEESKTPTEQKNLFLKNKKFITPILLALASTLIQLLFIKSCHYLSADDSSNKKYAFVVSRQNVAQGEALSEQNTKLSYLDLGEGKANFILNSEFQKYIGHKIKINLSENTPILKNSLINNLQELSLPEKIPHGKRFYTVDVDPNSLSSMIKVGDKVDMIAHIDISGFGKATETILNRIKIIGIGDNFNENSSNQGSNSLSFYLTPEEVKIISFMKPYSQFTVALRNPNDFSSSDTEAITFNKFIQNEKIQRIFKNDSFKIIEGDTIRR